jgi:hypothetical protein
MKTGQSLTDTQGTTWTVGQELGRGGYARAFVARSATGREAVLKVALEPADLFGDDADSLAQVCSAIVREQAALMREHQRPWLPELLGEIALPGGANGLLMPRFGATLATRLRVAAPLAAVLTAIAKAAEHAAAAPHGNLRPENVLIADDGRVVLSDPLTTSWVQHGPRLEARLGARDGARAPESRGEPTGACDAYALSVALFQAAMATPRDPESRREDLPAAPRDGLDKQALARIKDRVLARLDLEKANPRFAPRLADRLCALLNRGLSQQAAPSPPYRFATAADLHARVQELIDLVAPRVISVGKVLLAPTARDGVFGEAARASFSTTVTVTEGISHEDLAAGLLVRDLDADADDRVPVPEASFSVKPHPSGRLRFDFTLPEIRPGRYAVRIAFAVKDANSPPVTTDGHFELRPPPGYVPPADDAPAQGAALPFPGAISGRPRLGLDEPRFDPGGGGEPLDPFPTPIAPSDPGSFDGFDDSPPPVLRAGGPIASGRTDSGRDARTDSGREPRTHSRTDSGGDSGQVRSPAPLRASPTLAPAPALAPIPSISPTAPDRDPLDDLGPPDRTAEAPRRGAPPPPPPSGEARWGAPGTWEELPGPNIGRDPMDLGFDPPLADLPPIDDGGRGRGPFPAALQRALDAIRDNPWIAMGALVAALVALLVLTGVLFQSCAT